MLDQYDVLEELGNGTFGTVFKARHRSAGWLRAIKRANDPEVVAQFHREAVVLDTLNHPNIVRVYELVDDPTSPAIILEYVDGPDLQKCLARGPLSWRDAVGTALQVLDGLQAAHDAGLVHGDIKPSHILCTQEGQVKLADFGLVAAAQRAGATVDATTDFTAPETAEHGGSPASDLFSVGVVLYQCLTGYLPMGAFRPPSQVNESVPSALDPVVMALLSPDPGQRPPSASEARAMLWAAYEQACDQEPVPAPAVAGGPEPREGWQGEAEPHEAAGLGASAWRYLGPIVVVVVVVALVAGMASLARLLRDDDAAPDAPPVAQTGTQSTRLPSAIPLPPRVERKATRRKPDRPTEETAAELAGTVRSGPSGAAPSGSPIKIGAILSITGPAAPLGQPEARAVRMAVEQVNAEGGVLGRPVDVIIQDDKGNASDALSCARELVTDEKVCAIVGPSRTPTTMGIKSYCQDEGVPLVACASGRPITEPLASYVFSVAHASGMAVAKIVDQLKMMQATRIGLLRVANPFGEDGEELLREQCPEAGLRIVAARSFASTDTDVTAQLTALQQAAPDALVCWATNPGTATAARDWRRLGGKAPLIQSHGAANPQFIELAGDAAEGVMLPIGRLAVWQDLPERHPQKAVLRGFAESFRDRYDTAPDTFAGHGYDAAQIVLQAIKRAGRDDPAAVRKAIEATRDFAGTTGVFSYGPDDHNGLTKDAFAWAKIENGGWVLAE